MEEAQSGLTTDVVEGFVNRLADMHDAIERGVYRWFLLGDEDEIGVETLYPAIAYDIDSAEPERTSSRIGRPSCSRPRRRRTACTSLLTEIHTAPRPDCKIHTGDREFRHCLYSNCECIGFLVGVAS